VSCSLRKLTASNGRMRVQRFKITHSGKFSLAGRCPWSGAGEGRQRIFGPVPVTSGCQGTMVICAHSVCNRVCNGFF